MKIRLLRSLPLVFIYFALSSRHIAAQTYTFDGRTLQRWQGDPATLKVSEWQIWLYRRGQATGAANHWGAISESSADKAMATLKRNQDFEQRYCKFFGKPPDCEKDMTYFNPLGPIAIMKTDKSASQRIVTDLWSMKESRDRLKKLMELYEAFGAAYNPYSYRGTPGEFNPFDGVGAFVMDYGASLKAAADKLKQASEQLYALNNSSERELESSLDEFDAIARDQADRVSALESDNNEIQSKFDRLKQSPDFAKRQESQRATNDPAPNGANLSGMAGVWTSSVQNNYLNVSTSGNMLQIVWHMEIAGDSVMECGMSGTLKPLGGSSGTLTATMRPSCRTLSGSSYALEHAPDLIAVTWYSSSGGEFALNGTRNGQPTDLDLGTYLK
jgi:hypothetical protein